MIGKLDEKNVGVAPNIRRGTIEGKYFTVVNL